MKAPQFVSYLLALLLNAVIFIRFMLDVATSLLITSIGKILITLRDV